MKKRLTLCLIHEGDKVLLGMKKRGFGAGRWNGFGGKVQEGESLEQTAIRETFEECGLIVEDLEKVGILEFIFKDKNNETLEVHIFKARKYRGHPQETPEMKPQWFDKDKIPFQEMWSDDAYWFPFFLQDRKFQGYFIFDKDEQVHDYRLDDVETLSEPAE